MARTKNAARKNPPKVRKTKAPKVVKETAESSDDDNSSEETIITNTTETTEDVPTPKRGRKRVLEVDPVASEGEEEDMEELKKVKTEYTCDEPVKSHDGQLKIISWNVAGFRSVAIKGFKEYIEKENPDIVCLQETKVKSTDLPKDKIPSGYSYQFIHCQAKPGFHGTGVLYKNSLGNQPIATFGIGVEKHDGEGRVITLEFEKFYLVNTYIPNAGTKGLQNLEYRTKEWDVDFQNYLKELDKKKPIVWCGDINVAHTEIDLKNPKTNTKSAGFTIEERTSFSNFLSQGFIDSYRHYNPGKTGAYTFWSYFHNARANNAGWRLDYFVVSKRFINSIKSPFIRSTVMGSDHCPIGILVDLNEPLITEEETKTN